MSIFEITDDQEEPDPLNLRFGNQNMNRNSLNRNSRNNHRNSESNFCPYCGTPVQPDFEFCPKCGKDI